VEPVVWASVHPRQLRQQAQRECPRPPPRLHHAETGPSSPLTGRPLRSDSHRLALPVAMPSRRHERRSERPATRLRWCPASSTDTPKIRIVISYCPLVRRTAARVPEGQVVPRDGTQRHRPLDRRYPRRVPRRPLAALPGLKQRAAPKGPATTTARRFSPPKDHDLRLEY
jgi:hypothetical protein